MANWSEQLDNIQKLRNNRRQADDELYNIKLELLKAQANLNRVTGGEIILPSDNQAVKALQQKIKELESRLKELDKKINVLNELKEKIRTLEKQIRLIEAKIHSLENDRERNRQLIATLTGDLRRLKAELVLLQRKLQETEAGNAGTEEQRRNVLNELKSLRKNLNDLLQPQAVSPDSATANKRELEEKKKRAKQKFDSAINDLNLAVEAIYVDPHPRSVVSNLDDSIPFLLLPVRIETRFMTKLPTPELWIRVYPDEIAIHTHEKTLTEEEIAEGKKYWGFLLDAEKKGGEEKEELKKDAWSNLVSLFSSQRSAWIANQTKPTNWNEVSTTDTDTSLIFPTFENTKPFAWSRAPRTNVLPDKFVVMLYQGNAMVKELIGPIITDELYVGPDPLEPDESFEKSIEDNTLKFGVDFDWTSDFDKAVLKGMGFKTTLTPEQASRGFSKILVLGVYASADKEESKEVVETLIDNHHYSPKGFGIVKQGTPTNNTEKGDSGFSNSDPFDSISYFTETGDALFDEDGDCDGKNLADALGIASDPLQYVANSDAKDKLEATMMNTALYPSTLGYYFDTMMKPLLTESAMDTLRSFFIEHVSGRGPLPAIRVGDQPYGILLTSDFSKWQFKQHETAYTNSFLNTVYKTLDHYHTIWKSLGGELMYTGKPAADPSDVLMNVLGLQSGSVSFFQRNAFSHDQVRTMDDFISDGKFYVDMIDSQMSALRVQEFLESTFNVVFPTINGKQDIPQLLEIIFQHYHTRLSSQNVIENFPLSEDQALHNYTTDKNFIHWLAEATTVQQLERQFFGEGIKKPTSLLYMQLRRSLLLAIVDASVNWFKKNNIDLEQVKYAKSFHGVRPKRDLTKWEVMKGKIANALPQHPFNDKAIADHLLTTGHDETDAQYLKKVKTALGFLAGKSTASLERTFTEHLDTCTYRLDAWQTAIFDQRLRKQRRIDHSTDQPRKKGIYLGTFGWVEDIRPSNKQQVVTESLPEALQPPAGKFVYEYKDNGGFVHAPSINQATAAAVLRSGYLGHASVANPDVMAVNLSSARIRAANFILEGLRHGQTLECLLGFQFERGLHDRGSADDELKKLNEYLFNFRDTFKIVKHRVKQQGVPDTTTETIETNNVVNGLRLAETKKDYPYDVDMNFSGVGGPQRSKIEAAIKAEKDRLEDTLDAFKDLLLSESIYQMVQGNFDRAAAVTTALRDSNIPPSIDVIDTPATNHLSFTNRVTVQFDSSETYSGASHRAKMEAGMNKWLREVTGEPSDLICIASHTAGDAEESEEISMASCNLEPVDLIYNIGSDPQSGSNHADAAELESRIAFAYRTIKALDDDTVVKLQFIGTAEGDKKFIGTILPSLKKIKQIITDSRPLSAQDFDSASKRVIPDKENPNGYVLDKIAPRINESKNDFENLRMELRNIPITKIVGDTTEETSLGSFFDKLDEEGKELNEVKFTFNVADALTLQSLLISISNFGLADSFPQVKDVIDENRRNILLEQAMNVERRMKTLIDKATELVNSLTAPGNNETAKKVSILLEAGKTIFGENFTILPCFNYNNPSVIQQSINDSDQLLMYATETKGMKFPVDEWIQKIAAVRPKIQRWEEVRTLYELFNDDQLELSPVQVPYRSNDSWLAVEFPEKNADDTPFTIAEDTISITMHGESALATGLPQSGLLIDDWTEVVPGKEVISGLTFNYNQPDAMAPQVLLLAVTPEETGKWDWNDLVGILNDTLLRAKLRAVEPALLDKLKRADIGVLLPAIMSVYSQRDWDISLDYRNNEAYFENNIPLTSMG